MDARSRILGMVRFCWGPGVSGEMVWWSYWDIFLVGWFVGSVTSILGFGMSFGSNGNSDGAIVLSIQAAGDKCQC